MKLLYNFLNKLNIHNFDFFSLGNSAILYYFVLFYLMPVLAFFGASLKFVPSSSIVPYKAIGYATIGFIALIMGYLSALPILISKKIPNIFKKDWNFSRVSLVFGIIFLLGLAVKSIRLFEGGYYHIKSSPAFARLPFYNLIGTLDWLSYIALAIAFITYFHFKKIGDKRYKIWRYIAWGSLILEIVYAVPSCGRMEAITPIIIYLIIRWYVFERSFLNILLGAGAILIFIFPVGNACRHSVVVATGYNITLETARESVPSVVLSSGRFVAESFLSRINQSVVLSAIINSPERLEYGSSFKEIFLVFSPPRFLWKDKPESINAKGNEFGHRLGLLYENNFNTSVGPTNVGDWYMNFGLWGIALGMFFMGMLYRIIYEFLINRPDVSLSGIMIYAILWINIIKGMEDWVAPVWAGIIKLLIIIFAIHLFLIGKFRFKQNG